MYAWIWRKLPFGVPGKIAGSVLLTTLVASLLWFVVFPWAEPLLPFDDVQVTQDSEMPAEPGELEEPGAGNDPVDSDGHELNYSTVEPSPTSSTRR